MFEESVSNGLLLIESKTEGYNDAFVKSMVCKTPRRSVIQNAFERTGSDNAFIDTVNAFHIKYSFDKEFPRHITNANAIASPKFSSFFQVMLRT